MKKIFISVFVLILFQTFFSYFFVRADSYGYNNKEKSVPSQSGYALEKTVYGKDLEISDLNCPSDIFRYDDVFYIADSGNNRIISVNSDFSRTLKIYDEFIMPDGSKTLLKNPSGVYVTEDKIYIADSENSRILVSDYNSDIILEIKKPDDKMYGYNTFTPQKILADKTGNIYAVLSNITSGSVMFDSDGIFRGFYGANRTDKPADAVFENIKDVFRSDEKKARQSRHIPSGITNFDIDSSNFIYTCTQSASQYSDVIKKINSAGKNLFMYKDIIFGNYPLEYSNQKRSMICDIDIDDNEYINCLDFNYGHIFQYDKECNLMFVFGGISNQKGGFDSVSAIESTKSCIYVLDSMKCNITIFKITEFGEAVHKAENLYNSGLYEESLDFWYDVLRRDGNYRQAYAGIASAFLIKKDYINAMNYAEIAEVPEVYNKAFEGYRSEFVSDNFIFVIISAVIILFIIYLVIKKLSEIKIKYSFKISLLILIILFFAVIADGRLYGLQFKAPENYIFNIIPYFIKSIGLFFIWVLSNRAVSTFFDGCADFKSIFIQSSYALIPYILQLYINTLLSHVLIEDEYIFMQVIEISGIILSFLLLFIAIQKTNQYSFRMTVLALVSSVIVMAIIFCLVILMLSLFQQIYIFAFSVFKEIFYRIRN